MLWLTCPGVHVAILWLIDEKYTFQRSPWVFIADIHPSQQGILSQQVLGQKSLHLCTRTPNTSILFYTKLHIPSFSDKKNVALLFGNLRTFHAVKAQSLCGWSYACDDAMMGDGKTWPTCYLSNTTVHLTEPTDHTAPATLVKWVTTKEWLLYYILAYERHT